MTQEEMARIIRDSIEQLQDQEAAARFAADPHAPVIIGLLHDLIGSLNQQVPNAIQTEEVNVFGLTNNRLEPLHFNGNATFSASGEVCVPRACTSILGVEVCVPPFDICASGKAHAGLDRLSGLSTLQILNIGVTDFSVSGNVLNATGKMTAMAPALVADGYAAASGGPVGISIPVDASVSALVWAPVAKATTTMSFNLDQRKLTAMKLDTLRIEYGNAQIHIKGMGAFSSIVDELVQEIQSLVAQFFNEKGAISDALKGVLQKQIDRYVNTQATAAATGGR